MIKKYLCFAFLFFLSVGLHAQKFPTAPNPPRLVVDYTLTLLEHESDALEKKLVAFDDSTSTQISIVIIRSTDGFPIDMYSFDLAEKWGIGQKQKDNGILILVAKEDRNVWIATGYGVEGAVTDAMAKRIIEQVIIPNFRANKFYIGLDEASTILMSLLQGEFDANELPEESAVGMPWAPIFMILLFILFVLFLKYRQVKKYAIVNEIPFWTAWHILNAANAQQRGRWDDFRGGRGPFGGGGMGGSGGGFGGFGGGSFGGGGAGGSW